LYLQDILKKNGLGADIKPPKDWNAQTRSQQLLPSDFAILVGQTAMRTAFADHRSDSTPAQKNIVDFGCKRYGAGHFRELSHSPLRESIG
jgi:hypothetical protein